MILDQKSLRVPLISDVMAADHNALGAAIKIVLIGGSELTHHKMRSGANVSYYLWQAKRDDILRLVDVLERSTDAEA